MLVFRGTVMYYLGTNNISVQYNGGFLPDVVLLTLYVTTIVEPD